MNFNGIAGVAMRLPELIGIVMIVVWTVRCTKWIMRVRARGESIIGASWKWMRGLFRRKPKYSTSTGEIA